MNIGFQRVHRIFDAHRPQTKNFPFEGEGALENSIYFPRWGRGSRFSWSSDGLEVDGGGRSFLRPSKARKKITPAITEGVTAGVVGVSWLEHSPQQCENGKHDKCGHARIISIGMFARSEAICLISPTSTLCTSIMFSGVIRYRYSHHELTSDRGSLLV